jgi:hypothetical protein
VREIRRARANVEPRTRVGHDDIHVRVDAIGRRARGIYG